MGVETGLFNVQYLNSIDFALASRTDPFLMAKVLANVQIHMACHILIIAGSLERSMPLNGRKEPLNQNVLERLQEV
jgi:hypothetical protein